jgi:hypothetical protein
MIPSRIPQPVVPFLKHRGVSLVSLWCQLRPTGQILGTQPNQRGVNVRLSLAMC